MQCKQPTFLKIVSKYIYIFDSTSVNKNSTYNNFKLFGSLQRIWLSKSSVVHSIQKKLWNIQYSSTFCKENYIWWRTVWGITSLCEYNEHSCWMIRITLVHVIGSTFGVRYGMQFTLTHRSGYWYNSHWHFVSRTLMLKIEKANRLVREIGNYFFLHMKLYVCKNKIKYFQNILIDTKQR